MLGMRGRGAAWHGCSWHIVEGWAGMGLTLRYSTGLVTLNLSMVVMMMAGVVRKKSRMKRTTLITRQRSHQMKPRMERCSLGKRGRGRSEDLGLWQYLPSPHLPGDLPSVCQQPHPTRCGSPVDVLRVRGIGHCPVGDMQRLTAGGGARLPAAGAALAFAHVEVF